MADNEKKKGYVYLFSAFTLAGTSVISARLVSGKLGIFTIAVISMFFAIVSLLPFCIKKIIPNYRAIGKYEWFMLLMQSFFGIFLFRILLLLALLRTSAAEAGILTGATPAITAFLAWQLLKETLDKKVIVGIVSTTAGILILQGVLSLETNFAAKHLWGNIFVLLAASSESLFNVFSRMFIQKIQAKSMKTIDPFVQTITVSSFALVLCIIPALFEQPFVYIKLLGWTEWLALFWYGTVVTAFAFVCWYAGIKRHSAYKAAIFSGMMPLSSLILAVTLLGEKTGWHQLSGCMLIILGMLMISIKAQNAKSQSAGTQIGS